MPKGPVSPAPRRPHMVHLNYCIHRDAYDLLVAACPVTPTGRKVGMAHELERCIYLVLGGNTVRKDEAQEA